MRKVLILSLLTLCVVSMFANDIMQPSVTPKAMKLNGVKAVKMTRGAEKLGYSWDTEPTSLGVTYYDYMPGSYNSSPLRIQSGDNGAYVAYHAVEQAGGTRRVKYAHIDSDGVPFGGVIGTNNWWEGYAGIDIDPETNDPIVAWHANSDTSNPDLEVVASYDLFHWGSPGIWKQPFEVMFNDVPGISPDDEFIWPYVEIGPSPTEGKRRVYITANNASSSPIQDLPSENVLLAYADFDQNDFDSDSSLEWHYVTIDQLDKWHNEDPEWVRPNLSFTVAEDGTLAYFGYNSNSEAICFINTNYGAGDWEYYSQDFLFPVENPDAQNGVDKYFVDEDGNPFDLYISFMNCNHHNAMFTKDGSRVMAAGNFGMRTADDAEGAYTYWPVSIFPKVYYFDMETKTFGFNDLELEGKDPNDLEPMLPWHIDLETGGYKQEATYDADGYLEMAGGYPFYWYDSDKSWFESSNKLAMSEDGQFIVALWQDGLYARWANDGAEGYEDWLTAPEIAFVVSQDGGQTWSKGYRMNAVPTAIDGYDPKLDGMIPEYVYPGDVIQKLGENSYRMHLFFLDDNDYGSYIQGNGTENGGNLMYGSIVFGSNSADEPVSAPAVEILGQNYPNPFNPTTSINYNMPEAGHVTIEVYNVKGQKVTTLVDADKAAGNGNVTWFGKDANNNSVASGIYFYKMKAGNYTSTKKMILMK